MALERDWPNRVATLALMGVAYATCEVASYLDGQPRTFGVLFGVMLLGLAACCAFSVRPKPASDGRLSWKWSMCLGLVLVLPLMVEPLLRSIFNVGFPLEMQLVNGLRTVGLGLAGLSAWRSCRRLAGVVALFLALFASAMGDQPAIPYLLVAFAIVGGLWLVIEQVDRNSSTNISQEKVIESLGLRIPYRGMLMLGLLLTLATTIALAGPDKVLLTLGELVPTSGGSGDTDIYARFGVGDGPEEVAGDNAMAAGMVETEKSIEDNKNALIDAVSDMYGDEFKPNKDQEKMVAGGLVDIIELDGKPPENRRPSRDFGTNRNGPKSGRKPSSRLARGIFEIDGRTPLHVRLVVYDRYDASQARWLEAKGNGYQALTAEDDDWMRVVRLHLGDWYKNDDTHKLKTADMFDNLVPTPTSLSRLRIDRVNQPRYYQAIYDGVFALNNRTKTPPGVVVTTECHTADPSEIAVTNWVHDPTRLGSDASMLNLPEADVSRLKTLAQEWTKDVSIGWPQIEAIRNHLRSEFVLDRDTVAPPGHPSPVLWFLTESHRGPDYLFAGAAVLLYRTLGYPSRLSLGYYASPAAYDAETEHTPVTIGDLHFWPEVLLSDKEWLVIEPTPGYETLPPLLPWSERIWLTMVALGQWAWRNIFVLSVIVLSLLMIYGLRRRIVDAAWTLHWHLQRRPTWNRKVLTTAKLLERRSYLAGMARTKHHSFNQWNQTLPQNPNR